jgi:predicted MFS family arabinose efflux permease
MVSWGTSYYGFAVLLPELEAAFHASRAQVSLALTCSLLSAGASAFLAGRAMRAGRDRELMALGSLVGAIGFTALAASQNLTQVYAAWIVIGASTAGTLYPPAFALITRLYPQDYRARITTVTLLGGLASTVFWPLLSWIVLHWGWREACLFAGALQVLVCLPIHWCLIAPAPQRASESPQNTRSLQKGAFDSAQRKIVVLLLAYMTCESLVLAALSAHLLQILRSAGMPLALAVGIASCFGLIQSLARASVLTANKKWSPGQFARIIVLLTPIAITLLLWRRESSTFALGFALLYGIGNGLGTIVRGTSVADLLAVERVAQLNGPFEFCRSLAAASGPSLAAWVYTQQGYDTVLKAMIALLLVSGSAMHWAWSIHDKRNRPHP